MGSKLAEDLLDCVLWAAVISMGYAILTHHDPVVVVEAETFDSTDLECRVSLLEDQIEEALAPYRLPVAREHEGRKAQVRRIRRD